ncbi:ABC transporter substrate-binding protein [Oceanobacillus massiliensis]|uniref:ABC transporter substrate-binding protein n=1 Tax=Oceanobacillus massiliensis TaxID=1465765 RepID=UPI00028961AD|nr:ABC transporter substrate-binding protein [Oceanobacillus massiliensis]
MLGHSNVKAKIICLCLTIVVLLGACSGQESNGATEDGEFNDSVKLVLNWFPKSQHGGAYAAQENGIYEENGLDVTLEPGGPQVSPIQIVASGKAEFGLAHADQLVMARNEGIELVSVAATMQGSPQALMFHEGHGVEDFSDLNGRQAFIQPGIPYWQYLKNSYDLSGVEELSYSGEYSIFMQDPEVVSQSFVTSEPYFMELEGIATETLLISESGYDPYNIVLFTTKEYIEENEETVKRFVDSYLDGWYSYQDSPDTIHEVINEANPEIELEALEFEEETQREFIFGGEAEQNGVGYMTEERWQLLIDQLLELEMLDEEFDPNEIFTTEFLPEN